MAFGSIVCGILGLAYFVTWGGLSVKALIFSVIGLILGGIGRESTDHEGASTFGMVVSGASLAMYLWTWFRLLDSIHLFDRYG